MISTLATSSRTRVQNHLRGLVAEAVFEAVEYDEQAIASVKGEEILPDSVEVNETSSEWSRDSRYGRGVAYRPADWTFELKLGFPREVSLEKFETLLAGSNIIARDATEGLRQISLTPQGAEYGHPPREGEAGGTRVTYTFDADIERA
jgi:hypothetical protein